MDDLKLALSGLLDSQKTVEQCELVGSDLRQNIFFPRTRPLSFIQFDARKPGPLGLGGSALLF